MISFLPSRRLAAVGILLSPLSASATLVWHSALDGDATALAGANGVPTGAPLATTDRNGNAGGAVLLSGSEFFNIGSLGSFNAGSMSIWVRSDDNGGERGALAAGATGGGTTVYFSIMNQAAGEIRVDLDDGALRRDAQGGGALTLGQWYHIVTTFTDDGTLRLYLDGVEVNTDTLAGDIAPYTMTFDGMVGGERLDGSRNWIGALDDARIYDNELSASEVTGLFNAGPLFIPEPSAIALLALGGLGLLRRRRI